MYLQHQQTIYLMHLETIKIIIQLHRYHQKIITIQITIQTTITINVLNNKIVIDAKEQYVSNGISIFVQSVFNALENLESKILNYEI